MQRACHSPAGRYDEHVHAGRGRLEPRSCDNTVGCLLVNDDSLNGRCPVAGTPQDQAVQQELALADRDVSAGELVRAAARVSNVLIVAPAHPAAHEMLARLAAHPRGGRDLLPLDDPLALATVVARAHVVAAEGNFDYGLRLLGKVQAHAPETAWADVPWVTDPGTASSVNPDVVTNLALDLLDVLRSHSEGSLGPAMIPYLQLVRNTVAANPDRASLLGAAGYLFRRFDLAEALGYAARSDQLAPCRASAVALGLIYRDLGRAPEALDAFERALSHDPGSLETYADICDVLLDADRVDEALSYARRALALDPGHICSQIAARAAQFRQTRKEADWDAFVDLCRAQPAGTHARRHGDQLLYSTVEKTASRTATLTGSSREVLAQFRRFSRGKARD
jgi:tetratricopeptide (TPR) repeat protein